MKIKRNVVPESTIDEFAIEHDLTMVVNERRDFGGDERMRFYATFKHAEIKRGVILEGTCGNGRTEEAAIIDYARQISGKRLVVDAYGDERREIDVPYLK